MRPASPAVPLRARALAGLVDGLLILVAVFTACIGALGGFVWLRRDTDPGDWDEWRRRIESSRTIKWWAWGLSLAAYLATAALRNVRTPGQRLLGLRTIDARSGGPVSLRSGLVRGLADVGLQRLSRVVIGPARPLLERRRDAARARLEAYRADNPDADADDPELRRLGRQSARSCLASLTPPLVGAVLRLLTARLSPRGQTLIDRLAGTVVVRERR